jgi:hypothetical protein
MKSFRLSSDKERVASLVFCPVAAFFLVLLLFALRKDLFLLIFSALSVALLCAVMGIYVRTVLRAVCIPDAQAKKLHVKGLRDYTLDLSEAATLETVGVKNGHVIGRALIFRNAEGNVVGTVPTLFTSRQGVLAEPMAMELAEELGLSFIANLNPWDYDEKARIEHEKQVAIEEKEAAKKRREAKIIARRNKLYGKKK